MTYNDQKYFEEYSEEELSAMADTFLKEKKEYKIISEDLEYVMDDEEYSDEEKALLYEEDAAEGDIPYGHMFYLQNLRSRYAPLTADELEMYLEVYKSEDYDEEDKKTALEAIFNSIDPLLEKLAKRYRTKKKDMDDLISEAHLRIVESGALFKYDRTKGKLTTYLYPVVRNEWLNNYSKERTLSGMSFRIQKLHGEILKARDQFYMINGRNPTDDELADMDTISEFSPDSSHERRLNAIREAKKYYMRSQVYNIDMLLGNDDDRMDLDKAYFMTDKTVEEQFDRYENICRYEKLKEIMRNVLSTREYVIISLINGLYTDKCYTPTEIGEGLGITSARVCQIYMGARKKLLETGLDDIK